MKTSQLIKCLAFRVLLASATISGFFCFCPESSAQEIPGMLETNAIKYHERLQTLFKAGETNVPLLVIDSFAGGIHHCTLNSTGKIISSFSGRAANVTDWNHPPLSRTNLDALISVLNRLPVPGAEEVPLYSQIHVSGIRSNEFIHYVYNVQHPPRELKHLCGIIGAHFPGIEP